METVVDTRLGSQAVLSNPRAPQYLAILDEAVLHEPAPSRVPLMRYDVSHGTAVDRHHE